MSRQPRRARCQAMLFPTMPAPTITTRRVREARSLAVPLRGSVRGCAGFAIVLRYLRHSTGWHRPSASPNIPTRTAPAAGRRARASSRRAVARASNVSRPRLRCRRAGLGYGRRSCRGDGCGSEHWLASRAVARVRRMVAPRFSLGPLSAGQPPVRVGTRVLDTVDVRDEARRVMTELVASTGESVDLAIRDGDSVVFIDKIEGRTRSVPHPKRSTGASPCDRGWKGVPCLHA